MTSLPHFQPCAGVNPNDQGRRCSWLMETSHESQLLHRYKPAFCNPMPFEVGEPISHLLETLSIKLLILVQHKNNACPMHANILLYYALECIAKAVNSMFILCNAQCNYFDHKDYSCLPRKYFS